MEGNKNMICIRTLLAIGLVPLIGCAKEDPVKTIYRNGQVPVTRVQRDDPEMAAAIQKAQNTLDEFIAEMGKPANRRFGIKAGIETPEGPEHIWITNLSYSNGVFTGVFANEPIRITGKHELDAVEVKREQVSDWTIIAGEQTIGGFTQKVLDKRDAESKL